MLKRLNFPTIDIKLTKQGNSLYVWDVFRGKQLLLTPEEWVRQHVLHFLVNQKNTPQSLIASEYSIKVNSLIRRCDGVVFGKQGEPIAIIECKAPHVKITEDVFYQIAQYNFKLKVRWLIISNGISTIIAYVNYIENSLDFKEDIPAYDRLAE